MKTPFNDPHLAAQEERIAAIQARIAREAPAVFRHGKTRKRECDKRIERRVDETSYGLFEGGYANG